MANEIQAAVSLVVSKGGASLSRGISQQYDMSGDDMGQNTQLVGTTDEQLVLPADVTTAKLILVENLDPTNYVELSYGTGGSFSVARACQLDGDGGFALFRPISTTIYAKANTAACRVQVSIVEA